MTVRPARSMVARRRSLEPLDLGIAADLDDALAADGQRLRDGEAVVDGDDLAVDQHGIGRLRPCDRGRSQDGKRKQNGAAEPHTHSRSPSGGIRFDCQPGSMPRFLKAGAGRRRGDELDQRLGGVGLLGPGR